MFVAEGPCLYWGDRNVPTPLLAPEPGQVLKVPVLGLRYPEGCIRVYKEGTDTNLLHVTPTSSGAVPGRAATLPSPQAPCAVPVWSGL